VGAAALKAPATEPKGEDATTTAAPTTPEEPGAKNAASKAEKAEKETPSARPSTGGLAPELVPIPGGAFMMGTDHPGVPGDGEEPARPVVVSPFLMDATEVSNEQFAAFVENASFVSESEGFGWSFVFHLALSKAQLDNITQAVAGAEWWLPVQVCCARGHVPMYQHCNGTECVTEEGVTECRVVWWLPAQVCAGAME
jgi:formylglycine-generating enzyme required for sulfatase activity